MTTLTAPLPAHFEVSNKSLWTGRILTAVLSALLLMDLMMKILRVPEAVSGTAQLGYPTSILVPLGIIQLVALALYLIPRTAVLGAIVWTGYLGGAVATHVRLDNPLFSHILSPVYIGAALWLALWLRDARLRALLPVRK